MGSGGTNRNKRRYANGSLGKIVGFRISRSQKTELFGMLICQQRGSLIHELPGVISQRTIFYDFGIAGNERAVPEQSVSDNQPVKNIPGPVNTNGSLDQAVSGRV